MYKPELLAPAGNLEKLKTAIDFGADAVYLGGNKLNLRAAADNFTMEELKEGLEYAHSRGRKVHVTLNVIPHNDDLVGIEDYITELYEMGVDAMLIADPGIISIAREVATDLEIHLSTQASNLNYKSALFWHKVGVKRIVAAREMSLEELKTMKKKLPETCDIEAFVHGQCAWGIQVSVYYQIIYLAEILIGDLAHSLVDISINYMKRRNLEIIIKLLKMIMELIL